MVAGVSVKRCLAVIGAGSWGTALAVHLARCGHDVRLWGRDESAVTRMAETRANAASLPGIVLPSGLAPTPGLVATLDGADDVVVVVPSHALRNCLALLAPL